MSQIDLVSALRLILRFADSPEVVTILQQTLAELSRLHRLEEVAVQMAELGMKDTIETDLIDEVARLTGKLLPDNSTIRKEG